MLLTIDVGNTNITMGVFDGEELLGNFRITTKINRTSDEFGIVIKDILRSNDLDVANVNDVIIASVVPNVMHSLTSAIIKYFDIKPAEDECFRGLLSNYDKRNTVRDIFDNKIPERCNI